MSLQTPLGLLALLIIPLALLALYLNRRRAMKFAIRMPAASTLAQAAKAEPAWWRHIPTALLLAAVAALALALAKPQVSSSQPVEGASVMLVTDHSGSMSATDVQPDRLSAAVRAAKSFLSKLPKQTRVGIVTYSDAPDGTQMPTTDRGPVNDALDAQTAAGATATGEALQSALDALKNEQGRPTGGRPPSAIILLSDGKTTTGRDPLEVAQRAKAARVPIYTVALGSEDATIPNPSSPLGPSIPVPPDPETLAQIAEVSGGRAFTTADAGELQSIYRSLGSRLASKKTHKEITATFAIVGLVLLVGAGLASLRLAGRLP
jgi:Ca-activated chloride channel family protein